MQIPARILRAHANEIQGVKPPLSERDIERRETILRAATALMAKFGRDAMTMASFATGISLSPACIRRLFPDLDSLLTEILRRHLREIVRATGAIPRDAPDRQAAGRKAYLTVTRRPLGGPTDAHLLLVRDRHCLPADLLHDIDTLRLTLGRLIAGDLAGPALALLDAPELTAAQIEAALAAIAAIDQHQTPQPEATPQTAAPAPEPRETPPPPAPPRLQTPIPRPVPRRPTPHQPDQHRLPPPAIRATKRDRAAAAIAQIEALAGICHPPPTPRHA